MIQNKKTMIYLSEPTIKGNEWKYVKECLDTEWVSSAGKYVDLFEQNIADYTGVKYAIACVNGTSALQVSLRLAGVQPGDEVIVPTLTFIAPINAIAYNGANPIFMDADRFYNIDAEKTVSFIKRETIFKNGYTYNKKTKKRISAILPVHVWGNAVQLNELAPLCDERNIAIVEDASESLGSFYKEGNFKGKHTGTIGKLGCLSFNGNKIITSGGGGMILTEDQKLAEKAKYLTTQAKDDKLNYIHNEIGYNFRLTNIQAALGVAQLEQLPAFMKCKKEIHRQYTEAVEIIERLSIARAPHYADNNHWMNLLQIDNKTHTGDRKTLVARLKINGIQTRPVWANNHKQKPYKNSQSYRIEHANELVEKSLCLPSSISLDENSINHVISTLRGNFRKS
jgi:aminotransferase in exopolysaccharide biosynthesis